MTVCYSVRDRVTALPLQYNLAYLFLPESKQSAVMSRITNQPTNTVHDASANRFCNYSQANSPHCSSYFLGEFGFSQGVSPQVKSLIFMLCKLVYNIVVHLV